MKQNRIGCYNIFGEGEIMVDTKALRDRIEAEISRLQEKLRAIEQVEQLSKQFEFNGETTQSPLPGLTKDRNFQNYTVIKACRKLIMSEPERPWTVVWVLQEIRSRGLPGATRQAVAVAMRRLVKKGVLEVKRVSRVKGNIYGPK